MIIEKLKTEDIKQVLELYKDLIPFESQVDKSTEIYEKVLNEDNYILLVAKEGNQVIGSALGVCCIGLVESFLVIEDVVVSKDIKRKGVGSKLMESLDEFAKKKKCAYAILVSSAFRTGAHKFYEKLGFTDSVKGFRKVY